MRDDDDIEQKKPEAFSHWLGRHAMGIVAVLFTIWGIGSIFSAILIPYVSWRQGAFGVMLLCIVTPYWFWFWRR